MERPLNPKVKVQANNQIESPNSLTIHRWLCTGAVFPLQFHCQSGPPNDRALKGLNHGLPCGIITSCQPSFQDLHKLVTRVTVLDPNGVQSAYVHSELDAEVIPFGMTWESVIEDCRKVSNVQT